MCVHTDIYIVCVCMCVCVCAHPVDIHLCVGGCSYLTAGVCLF